MSWRRSRSTARAGSHGSTTVVHLLGASEEGLGEDINYEPQVHDAAATGGSRCCRSPASRRSTSFSARLDELGIDDDYTRLGVRERRARPRAAPGWPSLAEAVGREPRPLTFVVSTRGDIRRLARALPRPCASSSTRDDDWTDEVVAELAATGAVDIVDLKGHYRGDVGRRRPDADALPPRRRGFPRRVDRGRLARRRHAAGAGAAPRPADLGRADPLGRRRRGAPFPPRTLNVKPSRFGSLRRLLEFYDCCAANGDRALRRRPVRARAGPRPDPAARLALPPRRAERRRAGRLQRGRAAAGPADEPARRPAARDGFLLPVGAGLRPARRGKPRPTSSRVSQQLLDRRRAAASRTGRFPARRA